MTCLRGRPVRSSEGLAEGLWRSESEPELPRERSRLLDRASLLDEAAPPDDGPPALFRSHSSYLVRES